MNKKRIFKGIATAVITPFKGNIVDYDSFGQILEMQINEGINALVVCGTTGEAATLSDKEHREVMKYAVEKVDGRVPVILGTGSNDTDYSISLSKYACELGADGLLCVTPYYNKTTQKGLIKHFNAIADSVDKPILLYNVPSRTGMNIEPDTYLKLSEHENIVGFKEANGNISKVSTTMSLVKDKLDLYSGNDDQIVPLLAMGGIGCISVVSNILPKMTCEITNKFFEGKIEESLELQLKLIPVINALFCETNPIPAKAAMAALGYCEKELRLPLDWMEEKNEANLLKCMKELGLNV